MSPIFALAADNTTIGAVFAGIVVLVGALVAGVVKFVQLGAQLAQLQKGNGGQERDTLLPPPAPGSAPPAAPQQKWLPDISVQQQQRETVPSGSSFNAPTAEDLRALARDINTLHQEFAELKLKISVDIATLTTIVRERTSRRPTPHSGDDRDRTTTG